MGGRGSTSDVVKARQRSIRSNRGKSGGGLKEAINYAKGKYDSTYEKTENVTDKAQ